MTDLSAKPFRATLVRTGGPVLYWTIASVPRSITDSWNTGKRPRVKGEINGFAFRTSLFPTGKGGFVLMVNRRMQSSAKAAPGTVASFRLEPDTEEGGPVMPAELKEAFAGSSRLRRWYERLPYGHRKYISDNITEPKSPEARIRRAERMAELLLSMMEGEREPPPILEAAFARQPLARLGWERMTRAQRRGHLWGIFYYKAPESRQKRAAKAVEDAIRIANGKSRASSTEGESEI